MRSDASAHMLQSDGRASQPLGRSQTAQALQPVDGTVALLPPPNLDSTRHHFPILFGPQTKTNQEIHMPVHSANRINSAQTEAMPSALRNLADERPDIKPETGKTSPRELAARDKGMRRQLSNSDLPAKTTAVGQHKVASKENKEEGSNQQRGNNSGGGEAPATPAGIRAKGPKPANRPIQQSAVDGNRGFPLLDLFGKFGQVILHAMDIMSKLYQQVTAMFMATMSRASRSADEVNRL
jgi:hypothetical protein